MNRRVRDDFGIIIKNKLNKNNMSQADLSRMIDVSDTTISRYILGQVDKPKRLLLERIAKVLKCSINEFYCKK